MPNTQCACGRGPAFHGIAKGLDRNAYVNQVLEAHVKLYLDELTVVTSMLRGNPLLPEPQRSHT